MDTLKVDSHYVLSVPPSWILVGTIADVDDTHVVLRDCAWHELVTQGAHCFGLATDLAATEKSWPLPDGTILRRDAILIAVPAAHSFRRLARADEVNAVRGAR